MDLLSDNVRVCTVRFNEIELGKVRLRLETLQTGEALPFGTYLPMLTRQGEVTWKLLTKRGEALDAKGLARLEELGISHLYVDSEDSYRALRMVTELNHARIEEDASLSTRQKAEIIGDTAKLVVGATMSSEVCKEHVEMGRNWVQIVDMYLERETLGARHLSALLAKDYTVYTHVVNVSLLSVMLAHHLRYDDLSLEIVGVGALFHDLGKKWVPMEILTKPGPLEPQEWEVMWKHPEWGYSNLRPSHLLSEEVLNIIRYHHEHFDGSGYPLGLSGELVDESVQLVHMTDCYDALTSERHYKPAMPPFDAIRLMLNEMGGKFNQDLMAELVKLLNKQQI